MSLVAASLSASFLAGCNDGKFHAVDVTGSSSSLGFTMTRAADGKEVTQKDYRGQIVLLYFGYTFCPDVCPTTLTNVDDILRGLGAEAQNVRVLFVTVDPDRDTLPILADYVKNFGTHIDGLRGTPDQLEALTRRYRVVYSVEPATKTRPYEVTHSSAIYVFDRTSAARLLLPSLDASRIKATTADLKRLAEEAHRPGLLTRLMGMV
ncbi:SCO family protein [Methylovirgula sp. HY1]|uniref:SCO family protein n=1 Tax=Methylovirgula sp. HY1 TaxID=2822761 RepID=UPI001C5BE01B|nr:SCO family protein [Methylovirgula sp. HY1]